MTDTDSYAGHFTDYTDRNDKGDLVQICNRHHCEICGEIKGVVPATHFVKGSSGGKANCRAHGMFHYREDGPDNWIVCEGPVRFIAKDGSLVDFFDYTKKTCLHEISDREMIRKWIQRAKRNARNSIAG